MPEKLEQMQNIFYAEAKKFDVLPLDNSTLARWNTPRPSLTAGRKVFTYSGVITGVPNSGAPSILNKSYTITAEVEIPEGDTEGMIVTDGGRFGGYGLFLPGVSLAMKKVLILTAVAEAATGVALLIVPSLAGRLLFGEELTGAAIPSARVTGIALIALGTPTLEM